MRRNRQLRDYRNKLLAQRMAPARNARKDVERRKKSEPTSLSPVSLRRRLRKQNKGTDTPSSSPIGIQFQPYSSYTPQTRRLNICHVIESSGVGGAQTMMMELVNALNKYYKEYSRNSIILLSRKHIEGGMLFQSYGIYPECKHPNQLKHYCSVNKVDIVVHHRISQSDCIRHSLPNEVKYVLVNHTTNSLMKMRNFRRCDFYVSVCDFLDKAVSWSHFIHPTRRAVILNGVESDYLQDIPVADMKGTFKTGRCHRMVGAKFRSDSLVWLATTAKSLISGLTHYIIGGHREIPPIVQQYPETIFHWTTTADRHWKMSILKGLDVYFYETFDKEGASIAILESLACGVPVLCSDYGGNTELILDSVNGFVCPNRTVFLDRMRQLASDPQRLQTMREQTTQDFDQRLHVRHTAAKYMQIFEHLIKG